jgi:hypothetical protein
VERGISPLMEFLKGHDKNISTWFMSSLYDKRVMLRKILFEINEEVIAKAMGLSCLGQKFKKHMNV